MHIIWLLGYFVYYYLYYKAFQMSHGNFVMNAVSILKLAVLIPAPILAGKKKKYKNGQGEMKPEFEPLLNSVLGGHFQRFLRL